MTYSPTAEPPLTHSVFTTAMLNEAATLGITPLQAYRREKAREEVRRSRVVRSTNWIK